MRDDLFPQVPEPQSEVRRRGTYFDVIMAAIVFLAAGFSAYTTYLGFGYDLPLGLAVALAVLIGLGLLGINLRVRDARRNGDGITRALIAFTVVFVFSFVSNTNAIYTYFIQKDIVGDTQEAAWSVFESESSRVSAELSKSSQLHDYQIRVQALDTARTNLRNQITDLNNPGRGERAKRHIKEIEEILGVDITDQEPPSPIAPIEELEEYARKLDAFIEEQAAIKFKNDQGRLIEGLQGEILKLQEFYGRLTADDEYDSRTTDLMRKDLQSIGTRARDLLSSNLTLIEIDDVADKTGSFKYTWRNFVTLVSPAAIVLSVLLGGLLDILPLLLLILLYSQEEVY